MNGRSFTEDNKTLEVGLKCQGYVYNIFEYAQILTVHNYTLKTCRLCLLWYLDFERGMTKATSANYNMFI